MKDETKEKHFYDIRNKVNRTPKRIFIIRQEYFNRKRSCAYEKLRNFRELIKKKKQKI